MTQGVIKPCIRFVGRLLEDWVEADPSILDDGYVFGGRQVHFDGGPTDLIVSNPQGHWVLIEINRAGNIQILISTQENPHWRCCS